MPKAKRSPEELRLAMVEEQLRRRGIDDPAVLSAMERIPRHLFLPEDLRSQAYEDRALSLAPGRTISQPYIVALMVSAIRIGAGDKVLEIGTGTGYQTAVLAALDPEIYSIELDEPTSRESAARLRSMGYSNVTCKAGNGFLGWPQHAPFDAIVVTAAPAEIPRELVKQLRMGGRMVVPLDDGSGAQELVMIEKTPEGLSSSELGRVSFVEMKPG